MAGQKIINWVTVAPQMFSEKAVNRRRFYPSRLYLAWLASYPLVHQPPIGAILKPRLLGADSLLTESVKNRGLGSF
jgi:hypothetical protein